MPMRIFEFTLRSSIYRRIYGRHAEKVEKAKRKARAHAKQPTGREARKQTAPTRNILGVLYEEWVPEIYGTVRNPSMKALPPMMLSTEPSHELLYCDVGKLPIDKRN